MQVIWEVKFSTRRKNFEQSGKTKANKSQQENGKTIKDVTIRENKSQDNSNSKK